MDNINFKLSKLKLVTWGRGRPRRSWMDGVKGCLSERGLSIPEAKECAKDRRKWRRIVGGRRR